MHPSNDRSDPNILIEKLRREHMALDVRLQELNSSVRLTPSEEMEVRSIKRQKLAKKDQILTLSRTIASS